MRGKIIKGVGGFYYIHTPGDKVYECKAKGSFRKEGIKPAVGDDVEIEILDQDKLLGNLVEIHERKNLLIRPAVANVDQAIIVFAAAKPNPNYNLLDRFLIRMEKQSVHTMICFNKSDLVDDEEANHMKKVYESCGYEVFITTTYSGKQDPSIIELKKSIMDKTTVFAGPSGVGKSSLLNSLLNDDYMETGAISEKIERGKHTTRHSELIHIDGNTYVMDTPGFSSLAVDDIEAEDLQHYYPEFSNYLGQCRFTGCVHVNEPDCAIKSALESDVIPKLRYDNYLILFDELKNRRRW